MGYDRVEQIWEGVLVDGGVLGDACLCMFYACFMYACLYWYSTLLTSKSLPLQLPDPLQFGRRCDALKFVLNLNTRESPAEIVWMLKGQTGFSSTTTPSPRLWKRLLEEPYLGRNCRKKLPRTLKKISYQLIPEYLENIIHVAPSMGMHHLGLKKGRMLRIASYGEKMCPFVEICAHFL